ncbi:MAG: TfoX/Sxy family protein [Saprospiraceae bacterium]|nr:TfoX/Sxy family protein [Saprospiraceae bacterium]
MPTDPYLIERIRNVMTAKRTVWTEKKMFGGDCFMVDDKMCFGTFKGGLMLRVDPEEVSSLVERSGADQMMHGGRPMTGYLFVEPDGYDQDKDLDFWVQKCLDFNPKAKSSKKKKEV